MSEAIPLLPILLTARACAAAMLLFVLAAPPLALFLARRRCALARAVEFVVTLPLVFPPIALGFLLLMALGRSGPVGAALESAFGVRIVFSEAGDPAEGMRYVQAGVDIVQCERFEPEELKEFVKEAKAVNPNLIVNAAGGINETNAASFAQAGADVLVTSSVYFGKPFDIKMRIERAE